MPLCLSLLLSSTCGPLLPSVHSFLGGQSANLQLHSRQFALWKLLNSATCAWASWSLASRLWLNYCSLANRITSTSCEVLLWHLVEMYLVGAQPKIKAWELSFPLRLRTAEVILKRSWNLYVRSEPSQTEARKGITIELSTVTKYDKYHKWSQCNSFTPFSSWAKVYQSWSNEQPIRKGLYMW